jgi:hypothetical protein
MSATTFDQPVGDQQGQLFEPDAMLPVQYFGRFQGNRPLTGEERLMLAILEDAANVYCGRQGGGAGVRELREVERWFASTDLSHVFSFERICQALDLDPSYIRLGVRRSRARQRQKRSLVISAEQFEVLRAAIGE